MKCVKPVFITVKTNNGTEPMRVPCGGCEVCEDLKIREWALRLRIHMVDHIKLSFITLTYDSENCPDELEHRDVQLFLKRLRKKISSINYFMCGEYGEKNLRPHYHFIMFGISPRDADLVNRCWSKGLINIGTVTPASIKYVISYTKKALKEKCQFITKPYQKMSKGIGANVSEETKHKMLQDGYITLDSFKYSIPRYFIKKLGFSREQIEALKTKCAEHRLVDDEQDAKLYEWYENRVLKQRVANQEAKKKFRKRKI